MLIAAWKGNTLPVCAELHADFAQVSIVT